MVRGSAHQRSANRGVEIPLETIKHGLSVFTFGRLLALIFSLHIHHRRIFATESRTAICRTLTSQVGATSCVVRCGYNRSQVAG
ncbi:hypothetical protein PoB_000802300 [Plakobranchus ocellatus]|uniref:Uncharacterized protein n=1 Tax=Plakobranchus ocellatus TaxID=259542 RepID=A0AAV3YHA3_9GAST|nr:hypothetical protein PoB_000802300 [Plakobranchus ocellatus]